MSEFFDSPFAGLVILSILSGFSLDSSAAGPSLDSIPEKRPGSLVEIDDCSSRLLGLSQIEDSKQGFKGLFGEVAQRVSVSEFQGGRDEYVRSFESLQFAGPAENERFLEFANDSFEYLALDLEMARLSDVNETRDKALATAISNRFKLLVIHYLSQGLVDEKLNEAGSGVGKEKLNGIKWYSDFKSSRFYISKGADDRQLASLLDSIFLKIQAHHSREISENQLLPKELPPESLFRGGLASSSLIANLAARFGRNLSRGESQLIHEDDSDFLDHMQKLFETSEVLMDELLKEIQSLGLSKRVVKKVVIGRQGRKILSRKVLALARKSKTPKDLHEKLSGDSTLSLLAGLAEKIFVYAGVVEQFSAPLQMIERREVNLNRAVFGGGSLDFEGLGAENLYETALALRMSPVGASLQDLLSRVVQGEQKVTRRFLLRKKAVSRVVKKVFGPNRASLTFSGDDGVIFLDEPMLSTEKHNLIAGLSRMSRPSGLRLSFVPEGIKSSRERNILASSGEEIEKRLRAQLSGVLSFDDLNRMLIAIDFEMVTEDSGEVFQANLIFGSKSKKIWELEMIKEALRVAVEDANLTSPGVFQAGSVQQARKVDSRAINSSLSASKLH